MSGVACTAHDHTKDSRIQPREVNMRGAEQVDAGTAMSLKDEPAGELVRKATKGDERAWNELVRRFDTMILRVAQRSGLSAADAADARQATWVQLVRHADQVRDPDRIGGWLGTTARRESLRIATAATRQTVSADPLAESGWIGTDTDDVEAIVVRDQYDPALDRALDRLPVAYREVLELLTSDASPNYATVAKSLNLPQGSIGPMRIRALQMLRRDPGLRKRYGTHCTGTSSRCAYQR
jgi:RNA polymerase sigma factor (sigma-70 family)